MRTILRRPSASLASISFSNVSFYDADLFTFPSTETSTSSAGLQFELVEGGVYEGKGLNSLGLRAGEMVGRSIFEAYKDVPVVVDYHRRALAVAIRDAASPPACSI